MTALAGDESDGRLVLGQRRATVAIPSWKDPFAGERPDPAGVTQVHVRGPETGGFPGSLPSPTS